MFEFYKNLMIQIFNYYELINFTFFIILIPFHLILLFKLSLTLNFNTVLSHSKFEIIYFRRLVKVKME